MALQPTGSPTPLRERVALYTRVIRDGLLACRDAVKRGQPDSYFSQLIKDELSADTAKVAYRFVAMLVDLTDRGAYAEAKQVVRDLDAMLDEVGGAPVDRETIRELIVECERAEGLTNVAEIGLASDPEDPSAQQAYVSSATTEMLMKERVVKRVRRGRLNASSPVRNGLRSCP